MLCPIPRMPVIEHPRSYFLKELSSIFFCFGFLVKQVNLHDRVPFVLPLKQPVEYESLWRSKVQEREC